MSGAYDDVTMGLHRFNALMSWWSVPGAGGNQEIDAQISRFQRFSSRLQQACSDTCSRQMEAALSANDRVARAFQDLARCRRAEDVITAESAILATLFEVASRQAKTWIELTQKLQQSCVAMAREAAEDIGQHAPAPLATSLPVEAERQTAEPALPERSYT